MLKKILIQAGLINNSDNWSWYLGNEEKSTHTGGISLNKRLTESSLLNEINQIKNQYGPDFEVEIIRIDKVV